MKDHIISRHVNLLHFSKIDIHNKSNIAAVKIAGSYERKDIWDALFDLVTFAQFKKREKLSWKSVPFSKLQASLQLY